MDEAGQVNPRYEPTIPASALSSRHRCGRLPGEVAGSDQGVVARPDERRRLWRIACPVLRL